jgi:predicted SnoaL-like aldol condensation-catalyzing enzyme
LWDEAQSTLLIYSAPEGERERLGNIKQNPGVGLHFDMSGGDFLIITGEAYMSSDDPPSDQIPAWVEKYQDFFSQLGMTMKQAAMAAPVALRIRPLMLRYMPNPLQGADPEANKAIVRHYLEMWNTGNIALADEVLAPDWVDHAHPEVTGPESVKQAVSKIRAAFPDFHIIIESIVGEGDLVAVHATVRRGGSSRVMWFVRIADGKMAEMWTGSETAR